MSHPEPLLRSATCLEGTIFTISSLICIIIPGAVPLEVLAIAVPLYLIMLVTYFFLGRSSSWWWVALTTMVALSLNLVLGFANEGSSTTSAILLLAGGGLGAIAIVLHNSIAGIVFLMLTFSANLTVTLTITSATGNTIEALAIIVVGWLVNVVVGIWLEVSVQRAKSRITRLGKAHLAERQASEFDAQRRQSARLLHDTVLATLTLLAHSGVGVKPDALRKQAAEDAILLRQLRLGETPTPLSSGTYTLQTGEASGIGQNLQSVQQRFQQRGLTVNWHGDGEITLPHKVMNAFLLALGECLENIRRHSGVNSADVTITQDAKSVRVMVTDAGIGFETNRIAEEHLGIAQSIVARIRDVGGNTRIFSATGAGTTIVLEVPR